ncbi:mechanosensitive ion channel protein [Sulfitobacter sp. SK012]|uniref:mechanosensitive ion channel family protein n=1 Tax=Sulfitobacter sp. SK012 TaxID=1389005 RepID=UPI000E09FB50|nr:mechanosensitive ion channel family protein [Sulfitobacter sp. SK012]AXI45500.1 mechanosensitive ion channel protein [Sulfitobacter sp. SK012]
MLYVRTILATFFIVVSSLSAYSQTSPVSVLEVQNTVNNLHSQLNEEQFDALASFLDVMSVEQPTGTATPDAEKPGLAALISQTATNFADSAGKNIRDIPLVIKSAFAAGYGFFETRGMSGVLLFLGSFAVAVAAGLGAGRLASIGVGRLKPHSQDQITDNLTSQLRALVSRLAADAAGLIAFIIVSLLVVKFVFADGPDKSLAVALILVVLAVPLIARVVFRFLLAPHRPDLRTVTTDDWTAQFIYRNFVMFGVVTGLAFFLNTQLGVNPSDEKDSLRFCIGLLLHAWIVYITWRARGGLTSILLGDDSEQTSGLERMASWWPKVSMILVSLNWLTQQLLLANDVSTIPPSRSLAGLVLIVAAPFLDTMLRGFVKHLVPDPKGTSEVALNAVEQIKHSYVRVGRVVLAAVLVLTIGKLWGLSLSDFEEGTLGQNIAANGVQFLLVVAVGYIVWEFANLWVNNKLSEELPDAEQGEETEAGGAGKSRLASVLPLIHMALQATIVTITALLAISQLGINIAPLLAGAGVLGLAIGFGAQTLVKDVVSGVFFLLDDAFRVGEFVDVGGTLGSIENISVRSLRLRDATGPVHIVPYGEIAKLTNHSRDYVIMKLKFTVPFETDLEKVRKIFKRIGQDLMENPAHSENLLAPFKSQGVADVNDVGIVLRGKFTAKPGTQFTIRKDIYNMVQKAFDENGIQFARKEVRVSMSGADDDAPLGETQTKAVAAAGAEAADTDSNQQKP